MKRRGIWIRTDVKIRIVRRRYRELIMVNGWKSPKDSRIRRQCCCRVPIIDHIHSLASMSCFVFCNSHLKTLSLELLIYVLLVHNILSAFTLSFIAQIFFILPNIPFTVIGLSLFISPASNLPAFQLVLRRFGLSCLGFSLNPQFFLSYSRLRTQLDDTSFLLFLDSQLICCKTFLRVLCTSY